jgi:hypothetical protein
LNHTEQDASTLAQPTSRLPRYKAIESEPMRIFEGS